MVPWLLTACAVAALAVWFLRQRRFVIPCSVELEATHDHFHAHVVLEGFEVEPGDAVTLTVVNRGWETHPMHIHGHHVRIVSRDGVPSAAELWLDTFDVQPGEVWVVELYADNPGVWMDHCHNLDHAAAGMMMALIYRGVESPFELGDATRNRPE